MTIYRFGRPILSFLFKRKRIQERAQKIFEKLVGENQNLLERIRLQA